MSELYSRQKFTIYSDTGATGTTTLISGDTGPAFNGRVLQMRWRWFDTGVGDTGAALRVSLHPVTDDTGGGWDILLLDNIKNDWTKTPTQQIHKTSGARDTGAAYIISAGDHLRVKMTADKTLTDSGQLSYGQLYVWTG